MKKRSLGELGIDVSEVSFGTVSLGIPYGIGVNGKEDMISEKDAIELLLLALDKGINFFDTARAYGCSEERIGKAFKGRRQEVIISTKCAHLYDKNGQLPSADGLKRTIDASLEKSLSALQTDYVDIYMMHDGNIDIISNKTIVKTLSGYKKKGTIRATGISTYTVDETLKAIESGVWDVIQVAYNLMDQSQGKLFSLAKQNGVGIVVRSVLFKGVLTDRGSNLHPKLKAIQEHRELYNELLSDKIPALSDLATKFVLSSPEVSSVLVGIDKPEYLESALAVADGNYLDEETFIRAKQLTYSNPEFLNLHKWAIKGWLT
jgi:aryl-alcohol dehydrogenase-like predicted oxidoreductase